MTSPRISIKRAEHVERLATLKNLAHVIAVRFADVQRRAVDRGQIASQSTLAATFSQLAERADELRGGPVSTAELALLASRLVPDAVALLNQRAAA